jgi:acetate kinase
MENILILIPETLSINYYVFCNDHEYNSNYSEDIKELKSGKLKIRGSGTSSNNKSDFINTILSLINGFKTGTIIIKALYGGSEFGTEVVYSKSILYKLEKLISQSPLNVSVVVGLLKMLDEIAPKCKIVLFFETAFFAELPLPEKLYAIDNKVVNMQIRRFGYHGIFHKEAVEKISLKSKNLKKIISICLEPVPEIAAIYDGHPEMVSSGSTPLEGIPGNTTCGEIDPGILILLEEKKNWGAETINEILTRESGLSAIVGEKVSIGDVLTSQDEKYRLTKELLLNRILLTCGSALSIMNGFDAIAFSGRYIDAAVKLAEWLVPKLVFCSATQFKPEIMFINDSTEKIIANNYFKIYDNKLYGTVK